MYDLPSWKTSSFRQLRIRMKSMVFHYKKLTAISFLAGSTLCGIIAAKPPQQEKEKYKNLKVLSYNISEKDMDYVMEGFNAYLGVTCTFCHPYIKNGYDYYNDFVSDEFRNKRIARDMMRM